MMLLEAIGIVVLAGIAMILLLLAIISYGLFDAIEHSMDQIVDVVNEPKKGRKAR